MNVEKILRVKTEYHVVSAQSSFVEGVPKLVEFVMLECVDLTPQVAENVTGSPVVGVSVGNITRSLICDTKKRKKENELKKRKRNPVHNAQTVKNQ